MINQTIQICACRPNHKFNAKKCVMHEQDPTQDTEWNDALRKHGILPKKEKAPPPPEEVDQTVQGDSKLNLLMQQRVYFMHNFSTHL